MIRIKVEGKNIADIWKLACVMTISKCTDGTGNFLVGVRHKKKANGRYSLMFAINGDEIEVKSEDAKTGYVIEELPF